MSAHTSPQNPLYILAQVASEAKPALRLPSPSPMSLDSPRSSSTSLSVSPDRLPTQCSASPMLRTLRPWIKPRVEPFVPYVVGPKRKSRKSELDINIRLQMKAKRKALMDKANKIKSLENSPVNERQLSVLRMIYDEITMYPCESWMVLVAVLIHRAYKQVRNWFSNERQKNRYGDSMNTETEEGDKVKLRPSALALRAEWSDTFFEEVVMIHNYKVQRTFQSNPNIRRSSG